jgi:hypothetical protein
VNEETMISKVNAGGTPPLGNVTPAAANTPAPRSAPIRDSFMPSTSGMRAPAPPAVSRTAGLPPAELESAQQAIALASDGNDATAVVDWLRQHPDQATRDQFFDLMFQYGTVAAAVLGSTARLSYADVAVLSRGLEHAFAAGMVTADEFRNAIGPAFDGALPGDDHVALAELVGRTRNATLIEVFVTREIEIVQTSSDDILRSRGAATALSFLTPTQLQGYLATHGEQIGTLLDNVGLGPDADRSPALSKLLNVAGGIYPPTRESVALFANAVQALGENPQSRTSAARFFRNHTDAILNGLRDDSGSLGLHGQEVMSELFARTLFTDPEYPGQERLREILIRQLGERTRELETHAGENPPSLEAQRQARLLGSLVGAIEGGFQLAVDELDARNEAVEGMVNLLFETTSLLPDLAIPGIGGRLAGLARGIVFDRIEEWVVGHLTEDPPDASQSLPFHEMFGQELDNPALRSYYDAARADAFLNRTLGLS